MTNTDLKEAFNNLLEQAKITERRMRDILGQQQLNSEEIDNSIDEKCLRSRTPTEYINIVPKKMRFSGVDAEIITKGHESYSSQQDFHSSMADTVMKVDK